MKYRAGEFVGLLGKAPTREDANRAFSEHLTYRQVRPDDIYALEAYVAFECAWHDRRHQTPTMGMRTPHRKASEPRVVKAEEGIAEAYLRIDGAYFHAREAISFNPGGFIGFAGWASDDNVVPFLRAFFRWLYEWKHCVVEPLFTFSDYERGYIHACTQTYAIAPYTRPLVMSVLSSVGLRTPRRALACVPDRWDAEKLQEVMEGDGAE